MLHHSCVAGAESSTRDIEEQPAEKGILAFENGIRKEVKLSKVNFEFGNLKI